MASPFNPFAGRGQRGAAQGAQSAQGPNGRGRGTNAGFSSTYAPRGAGAPRAGRARGRGRGSATWVARGRGRGGANGVVNGAHQNGEGNEPNGVHSPFAQANQQTPIASTFGAQPGQESPFSRTPNGSPAPTSNSTFTQSQPTNPFSQPTVNSPFSQNPANMNTQASAGLTGAAPGGAVPVENASTMNNYQERYEQLKIDRAAQRQKAIKDGQMADPNQPTSLNQAITPVGTCTSMCPEFESVERIVQKMVDKCEKYLHPSTNQLQNMESKMLKRFRRSAAGYDEQLPSDIRTPTTLLQTMNYLMRHVISGKEPLAVVHKFVWDRTRSIRNDFSVQQLTQEADVKVAVICLERIARFHIVSLHLLSSPANTEPFDHHQEREQLNNTMLSLMYYYDDNRGRINFANEAEFRAYYILFSIHDQRPDLEARVQKWPADLLASPRVQVALELFAAAGNTWEPQGALDARRPNAIAQGFYTRFFNIINSPSVSYLMACVAEVYFNHIRQTAIRSIWKAYCRTPQSQQYKNDQWTVDELTKVLHFDNDQQTIDFCTAQDLRFAENGQGGLFLDWGDRHVDSVDFAPSSEHSFSETYVETKRAGRSLVAVILGMNIKEAARMSMIDRNELPARRAASAQPDSNDGELFVSAVGNQTPAPAVEGFTASPDLQMAPVNALSNVFEKPEQFTPRDSPAPFQPPGSASQSPPNTGSPFSTAPHNPFLQSKPAAPSPSSSPFGTPPVLNPFAKASTVTKNTEASPPATEVAPSPFNQSLPSQPSGGEKQASPFTKPAIPSSTPSTSNPFALTPSAFPKPESPFPKTEPAAAVPPAAAPSTLFPPSNPFPSVSTAAKDPVAPTSSNSMLSSGSNPFAASASPFSLFSKPEETTSKTDIPAGSMASEPSIFKPSSSPSTAAKNPFQFPSTSGSDSFATPSSISPKLPAADQESKSTTPLQFPSTSGTFATSSLFPKAPTASEDSKLTTATAAPLSTLFKTDGTPKDASTTSKNPFGFAQTSFPAADLAATVPSATPSVAPSTFSFSKTPEISKQPKVVESVESKAAPLSSSSVQSPFPVKDSIFAPPKAPESSQTEKIPAIAPPTSEKQPFVYAQPPTSPKSSETLISRSSAPAQVQAPVTQPFGSSASTSPFQPARIISSPTVPPASRSVSSARHPAHSPPQTLFEALRQPKLFDAKSSTYSPDQSLTAKPPLFPESVPSVAPDQEGSLKRQNSVTDADASREHKRRSSLKGKSTVTSSDGSFKRSVHFEEESAPGPTSSKEPQMPPVRKSSKMTRKKRPLPERTETPLDEPAPSSKLTKVSAPEEHTPFNFSVYKAENRPVPKLPILEKLEKKLAAAKALCEPRRMTEDELKFIEEARLRRARQVDEDEIALSRARILAEQLKNGPGIFDGWTGPIRQPWDDPNWNPVGRILEKYHPRIPSYIPTPLPPKLIWKRNPSGGYEVAYAPDTPDRPMSRTERRIRQTGARGLAHVPLDFQRRKRGEALAKSLAEQQKGEQKEHNGRKSGGMNGDSSRSV